MNALGNSRRLIKYIDVLKIPTYLQRLSTNIVHIFGLKVEYGSKYDVRERAH